MTPEQLGTLAASLKAALAIIEAAEENAAPTVTEVGGDGDPVRVRFERHGSRITYNCCHTDESLRGIGQLYAEANGLLLRSDSGPSVLFAGLYVRGSARKYDERPGFLNFPSPKDAAAWVVLACNAVAAFNAKWRAEKAKPTLEQDIEMVQGFVETSGWGKASSKDVLEAFGRIVAKVK